MSSSEISLVLKAYDEASSVFSSASANLDGALGKIGSSTIQVTQSTNSMNDAYAKATAQTDEINNSYVRVGDSAKKTSASTMEMVSAGNTLALSGVNLALSFERVEKAQLASDKANLNVEKSTERVDQATKSLAASIEKYGAGSAQAVDAQDKLNIATEQLSLAQERQGIVSNDLNQTYMTTALSIIPSVIGVFTSFDAVKKMLTASTVAEAVAEEVGGAAKTAAIAPTGLLTMAQGALNAVMDANPIAIVILALAGLVAGLFAAYNLCPPFRDAIDAIGKALGDGLGQAINYIKGGLEWLWNNVLVPLGSFLSGAFMGAINAVGGALKAVGDFLKPIGDAWGWLAGIVGSAIDKIGEKIEQYNDLVKAQEESTKNGLSVMENYYSDKFASMTSKVTDALNKQVAVINDKYAEMTDAENKAYQDDLSAFSDYWDKKFNVTQNELQKADQKINEYYDKQVKAVQDSSQKQIDAAKGAYAQELTDFTSFWNTKLGIHNTELDQVTQAITTHYDNEISDVRASYQTQIDATNTLYDDMLAATNAGLSSLRAAHQQSNDDNELLMLEQKVSLEQAHAAGLIDTETYEKQVADLTKAYNTQKGLDQDAFRLEELRLEKQAKADGITIEEERAKELAGIADKEKTDITGINAEKNSDLTAAQTTYKGITETDATALKEYIAQVKQDESDKINLINNQKDLDLKEAARQYAAFEDQHNAALLKLNTDKANEIKAAVVEAAQQKRDILAQVAAEINANTSLSENEKLSIIQGINDQITYGTQKMARDVNQACSDMYTALTNAKVNAETVAAAINGLQIAAAGSQMVPGTGQSVPSTASQAMIDWQNQNQSFLDALNNNSITPAQYNAAIDHQYSIKPAMAEGGIVTKPTLALIGEAGPEAVIPLGKVESVSNFRGPLQITNHINVHVDHINSELDLDDLADKLTDRINENLGEKLRRQMY